MRRMIATGATVVVATMVALVLGSGQALAHTRLESSDPADGARLDTAPSSVSLTFSEKMQAEFATITVIGPDGADHRDGDIAADGTRLGASVTPLVSAGEYTIGYRVVSEDGHPVTGSVRFTLTTDATPTSPAQAAPTAGQGTTPAPDAARPADEDSGGSPIWPWIVGAVVVVGGGVAAALRMGRK